MGACSRLAPDSKENESKNAVRDSKEARQGSLDNTAQRATWEPVGAQETTNGVGTLQVIAKMVLQAEVKLNNVKKGLEHKLDDQAKGKNTTVENEGSSNNDGVDEKKKTGGDAKA